MLLHREEGSWDREGVHERLLYAVFDPRRGGYLCCRKSCRSRHCQIVISKFEGQKFGSKSLRQGHDEFIDVSILAGLDYLLFQHIVSINTQQYIVPDRALIQCRLLTH
jgi:hypothetical protein